MGNKININLYISLQYWTGTDA